MRRHLELGLSGLVAIGCCGPSTLTIQTATAVSQLVAARCETSSNASAPPQCVVTGEGLPNSDPPYARIRPGDCLLSEVTRITLTDLNSGTPVVWAFCPVPPPADDSGDEVPVDPQPSPEEPIEASPDGGE